MERNGDMQIYPAVGTATGQGGARRTGRARAGAAEWSIHNPPAKASIAMFIRASDRQFIIRVWQRPVPSSTAVTGTQRIAVNGVPQPASPVSSAVSEWALPWIETTPDANVSGTFPARAETLRADFVRPGLPPAATCTWQFSRGKPAAGVERPVTTSIVPFTPAIAASTLRMPRPMTLAGFTASGSSAAIAPRSITLPGFTAAGSSAVLVPRMLTLAGFTAAGSSAVVVPRTLTLTGFTAAGAATAVSPRTIMLAGWTSAGP